MAKRLRSGSFRLFSCVVVRLQAGRSNTEKRRQCSAGAAARQRHFRERANNCESFTLTIKLTVIGILAPFAGSANSIVRGEQTSDVRSFPALMAAIALSACSLGPALQTEAGGYGDVLSELPDQVLLSNILHARGHAPIHLSDLSSITGSLNSQTSINASIPFRAPPKAVQRYGIARTSSRLSMPARAAR